MKLYTEYTSSGQNTTRHQTTGNFYLRNLHLHFSQSTKLFVKINTMKCLLSPCPILAPLSNPNSSKCLLIGVPLMAIVEVLQQVQMQTYKAWQHSSRSSHHLDTYVVQLYQPITLPRNLSLCADNTRHVPVLITIKVAITHNRANMSESAKIFIQFGLF